MGGSWGLLFTKKNKKTINIAMPHFPLQLLCSFMCECIYKKGSGMRCLLRNVSTALLKLSRKEECDTAQEQCSANSCLMGTPPCCHCRDMSNTSSGRRLESGMLLSMHALIKSCVINSYEQLLLVKYPPYQAPFLLIDGQH